MRRNLAAAAIVLLLPAFADAVAAEIAPGSRVRVTFQTDMKSHRKEGSLLRVHDQTLFFRTSSKDLAIPTGNVKHLEISTDRHSNVGKGALLGTLIGAGAGLATGAIATAGNEDSDAFITNGGVRAGCTILGGALGLVTGLIVGASSHHDEWEATPVPTTNIGFAPLRRDGLSMRVTIPLGD